MPTHRILLLSGGSQVAQFILQVLAGRRQQLHLVATNSIADDPGLWQFDTVYLVPATLADSAGYEARLKEIFEHEKIDLAIACRDDDIVGLARFAEKFPQYKDRALCGPSALALMMSDKLESYRFAKSVGLPFAESFDPAEPETPSEFAARVGYPLIAKPRDGFSSKGVMFVDTQAQLTRALARSNYVIEEYLGDPLAYQEIKRSMLEDGIPLYLSMHGIKHSIELMFDRQSRPAAPVFATHNRPAFRARFVTPNTEPATLALGERCYEVFSARGWRGPLNIQCQLDRHGVVKIHEFNGRYGALAAERWMLGFDELALGLSLFAGIELPPTRWQTQPASKVSAQLSSRGAHPADVAALSERGKWLLNTP
jgi:Carbamoyl-phosphate synthase L chain, ATP binding domain